MSKQNTACAKAWHVSTKHHAAIVMASTRANAMASMVYSARDAAISIGWCDIRCVRAPQYDGLDLKVNVPYDTKYILAISS